MLLRIRERSAGLTDCLFQDPLVSRSDGKGYFSAIDDGMNVTNPFLL